MVKCILEGDKNYTSRPLVLFRREPKKPQNIFVNQSSVLQVKNTSLSSVIWTVNSSVLKSEHQHFLQVMSVPELKNYSLVEAKVVKYGGHSHVLGAWRIFLQDESKIIDDKKDYQDKKAAT